MSAFCRWLKAMLALEAASLAAACVMGSDAQQARTSLIAPANEYQTCIARHGGQSGNVIEPTAGGLPVARSLCGDERKKLRAAAAAAYGEDRADAVVSGIDARIERQVLSLAAEERVRTQ